MSVLLFKSSGSELGIGLRFEGRGESEIAVVTTIEGGNAPALNKGDVVVRVDPKYFRLTEVENLLGDATKARLKLGWEPQITAKQMCAEMVSVDLKEAKKMRQMKELGYITLPNKLN